MASIQDIIKQLEELDAAGSASTFKGKTQKERTEALRTARNSLNLARDINKSDVKGLELRNKHLAAAQRELRADSNAYRVIEKAIDANKEYVKSQEQVTARLKTVKSSLGTFSTAMETGSGDIASYTNSFKDIPFVGTAIQDLGKRLDVNIESFRQLSSVGAAFGQNLVQLRETAASAGLPLADFVDLVGQNSESLAALYGSTTQGAKQFSKLSEQFRTTAISDLAPLGLTVADLNETLLTSLNLQRRSGMFGQLSNDMQIKSATALAKEMDRLTKLTGQNRSALTKNIEAQLSNERFLASLGTMTVETQARVSAFASSIGTLAPGLAEGFQDLIANAGTPVTEASRQLVQNIPEAGNIIRQLSAGTLSSSEAMVALRDAAKRSNESLRGVARTGTVEFARLFGAVNQLASAKLDETAVTNELTNEELKAQKKLTKNLTQFEDASKRLSAGFQSIETGFFATLGSVIGDGTAGINAGMKDLGQFLQNLAPELQMILFLGKSLGGYLLDKGARVLEMSLGVAAGIRMAGPLGGMLGGTSRLGKAGRMVGKGGLAGLGAAGVVGGSGLAYSAESGLGKAAGVGTSVLGGALTGAMFGGLPGAVVGGLAGLALGGASALAGSDKKKRNKGTMGMLGLASEPKTSMLQIESGERVLSRAETNAYNRNEVVDTGLASITASLESKFDSMVTAVNKTNSIQEQAVKALNTQVALTAAGNKINDNTRKGVASMGNLV